MVNKYLSVSIKWHSSSLFPLSSFHVVSKSHSVVYQAVHDRVNLSGGSSKYIAPITARVNLDTNGEADVNPPHLDEVCAAVGQMSTVLNDPELITSQWHGTRPNQGPAQAAGAEGSPCCTRVHRSFSLPLPTRWPGLILANAGVQTMASEAAHQRLDSCPILIFFFFLENNPIFLSHVLHLRQLLIYCCFDMHWHMAPEVLNKWFRLLQQLIYSLQTQPWIRWRRGACRWHPPSPRRSSSDHRVTGA